MRRILRKFADGMPALLAVFGPLLSTYLCSRAVMGIKKQVLWIVLINKLISIYSQIWIISRTQIENTERKRVRNKYEHFGTNLQTKIVNKCKLHAIVYIISTKKNLKNGKNCAKKQTFRIEKNEFVVGLVHKLYRKWTRNFLLAATKTVGLFRNIEFPRAFHLFYINNK